MRVPIENLLESTKVTEWHADINTLSSMYFSRNIVGPFILQMPDNKLHFIKIDKIPDNDQLNLLINFISILMPCCEYEDFIDLNKDIYMYESMSFDNLSFTYFTLEIYNNYLKAALLNFKDPLILEFKVHPSTSSYCREILRYPYDRDCGWDINEVFEVYRNKCL